MSLQLRCPDCNRQVVRSYRYKVATDVMVRKCRCGQVWQIIVRPWASGKDWMAHDVQWTRK